MAGFCDYLENAMLNEVFGAEAFAAPATLYLGLSTTTPTDAGGNITEPSGGSYARVAVTNNTTNWPTTTTGEKANGAAFAFPQATASWGTVTHLAIYDAETDGHVLCLAELSSPKAVESGDTLSFPIGSIVITLD